MSSPRPLEEELLSESLRVLDRSAQTEDARFEILEACASKLGGFTLAEYRERFGTSHTLSEKRASESSATLLAAILACPIPPSLALSALARPRMSASEKRTSGAYYTDFRLAQFIATSVAKHCRAASRVIDPSAGTGILLVAVTLAVCGSSRLRRARWLANNVTAWDMSAKALRGAQLALASLTEDLDAIEQMVARWRCHDSLLVDDATWGQYDTIIGNPPWEKIKLTRHEFVKSIGGSRNYGDEYSSMDSQLFSSRKDDLAQYGERLASRYPLIGKGEPDLYKAFLGLFFRLACNDGRVSVLVPAGLIRSQGTETLRRFIFDNASELSITIIENRARFFAIDTRFKFLALNLSKATREHRHYNFRLVHAKGTPLAVAETGSAHIGRRALEAIRQDLTIPEVRSPAEWRLFRAMSDHSASTIGAHGGSASSFAREVDMTRDRSNFVRSPRTEHVALVEGRMVHQHRFAVKAYRSGTGRSARWEPVPLGAYELKPQFWYPLAKLTPVVRFRTNRMRAGFCDITGQTNERSMLAAIIPPGVVCGNKVPTVTFPDDPSDERLFLWLAIVNSIPFDWALRRILTTTVNYFLLDSVPRPRLRLDSPLGRRLVDAARELNGIGDATETADPWRVAELRASIDISVHDSYGLGFADLELMLKDFPLLDGSQPALMGDARSTITRDYLLTSAAKYFRVRSDKYEERLSDARILGALPYVPTEYTSVGVEVERANA